MADETTGATAGGLAALTVLLSVTSIAVSLWWNAQLSAMIDAIRLMQGNMEGALVRVAVILLLSTVCAYVLSLCSSWTLETLAHDLRMAYARYFLRLPYAQIQALSAGESISLLQNEIEGVSLFLRGNLFSLVDDAIRFAATFSWMLCLNPSLTLLSSLPVLLLTGYTALASKLIGRTALLSQQANQEMTGFADTLVAVFPVLRLFGGAALLSRQYGQRLNLWEAATRREERRRALLMTLSGMLSSIPLLLLFLIGGTQVLQGKESLGTLYIFINLSGNVSGVMMNMAGRIAEFRRFAVNMDRLAPHVILETEEAA